MAEDQEPLTPTEQEVAVPATTQATISGAAPSELTEQTLPVNGAGVTEQSEASSDAEEGGPVPPDDEPEADEAKPAEDDDDENKPAVGTMVFYRSPMHTDEERYFPALVIRNDLKGVVLNVFSDTHPYIAKNVRQHESEFGHYRGDLPEPKDEMDEEDKLDDDSDDPDLIEFRNALK